MNDQLLIKNYDAEGAISARRIIAAGSADHAVIQAADVADGIFGVSTDIDAADGGRVDVIHAGKAEVIYGGVVARGNKLTTNALGKAVAVTQATDRVVGIALVSGVADDIGEILVSPH